MSLRRRGFRPGPFIAALALAACDAPTTPATPDPTAPPSAQAALAAAPPPVVATSAVTLAVETITLCGQPFSQVRATATSPDLLVRSREVALAPGVTAVLPVDVIDLTNRADTVTVTPKLASGAIAYPLAPPVPTELGAGLGPESSACASILAARTRYLAAAKQAAATPLVQVTFAGKTATLKATSSATTKQNLVGLARKPGPVEPALESLPGTIRFLIIAQDAYAADAVALKNRRIAEGIPTELITVSQLPGYDATAPTPPECAPPYDLECYHLAATPIPGVSAAAVPSLRGFHNQFVAGEPYVRVSFIPGLVRAYLRRIKAQNPLRHVLLVGDSEVLPAVSTPKVDFAWTREANGNLNALLIGVEDPNEAHLDYANGNGRQSLPTDLYYQIPDVPLAPTGRINYAEAGEFFWPCQDASGTLTQRTSCLPGEVRGTPDMSGYGWGLWFPLAPTFDDPVSRADFTPYAALARKDVLGVGRLLTHSTLYASGHDPSVTRYLTKLAARESALPPFLDHAVLTTGTNDVSGGIGYESSIQSLLGATTIYSNASPANVTVDTALADLANHDHTFWELMGHGAPSGIGGPHAKSFWLPHRVRIDNGQLVNTDTFAAPSGRLNQLIGGHYIGFAVANSCSPSLYELASPALLDAHTANPNTIPYSLAEYLISVASGGVAGGTFLNFFVGWSGADDTYNLEYTSALKTAWQACGRAGDGQADLVYRNLVNNVSWRSHQLVNRVFFGDPTAPIAAASSLCAITGAPPNPPASN